MEHLGHCPVKTTAIYTRFLKGEGASAQGDPRRSAIRVAALALRRLVVVLRRAAVVPEAG
jgi:hypothetical protein